MERVKLEKLVKLKKIASGDAINYNISITGYIVRMLQLSFYNTSTLMVICQTTWVNQSLDLFVRYVNLMTNRQLICIVTWMLRCIPK